MTEEEAPAPLPHSREAGAIEFSFSINPGAIWSAVTRSGPSVQPAPSAGSPSVLSSQAEISAAPILGAILFSGLVLRLALAAIPGFDGDIGTFQSWSNTLANDGPWNFYDPDFFTDYAPGYMYVLWTLGWLNKALHFSNGTFEYLLKLPAIAADLASAYLLYRVLEGLRPAARLAASALYLMLPASLLIGPIWGQVDSILALFLLLSVYFIGRERPLPGALAFTVGFLVKPQAIAALPFLAFWIMRRHPPVVWLKITGASLLLAVILVTPFFTYEPWRLVSELYDATNVENYRVNSFWAYNFWMIDGFQDGFKPDSQAFLGISHRIWGMVLFATTVFASIIAMRKSQGVGALALGTALGMLAFYVFLTRMHERYLFAFFLPCLAACVLLQSRILWAAFAGLCALHFLNLYHVYDYYTKFFYENQTNLHVGWFYDWFADSDMLSTGFETVQVLSVLTFLTVPLLVGASFVIGARRSPEVT